MTRQRWSSASSRLASPAGARLWTTLTSLPDLGQEAGPAPLGEPALRRDGAQRALGPLGTGKSHLSIALGLKACHAGYSILFLSAVEMVTQLLEAEEDGKLRKAIRRLLKPDLLIVDEVGYIPFGRPAANLFFQVVSGRYVQGSMILTSNRAFSGWGEIFGGDVVVAAAMIDRLVHHAEIISLKGSSYRLKGKKAITGKHLNRSYQASNVRPPEREIGPWMPLS